MHEIQPPLPSQTMPVPQAVPPDRLPKSTQTGVPVWQLTMPVLHAVGFVEQFALGVQALQLPLIGGEDSIHDWNYMLDRLGMLQSTRAIGLVIRLCGTGIIVAAGVFAYRFSATQDRT